MTSEVPLLIVSAATATAPFTKLIDKDKRINATLFAIEEWIKNGKRKIIICDGSGYDFSEKLRMTGVEIECLFFVNDLNNVKKKGKGHGEGEIIKYALKNSRILTAHNLFMKCTGKIYVKNYREMERQHKSEFTAAVNISIRNRKIDSKFFIAEKKWFLENLVDAYKDVDDFKQNYFEDVYFKILKKTRIKFISSITTDVIGFSGTNGKFIQRNQLIKYLYRIFIIVFGKYY